MKRNPRDVTIVRAVAATLIGSALAFGMSGTACAILIQRLDVRYDDPGGTTTVSSDGSNTPAGQTPSRDLLAQINLGSGHGASSAVGRFGDVGSSGSFTLGRSLQSLVSINSIDENFNLSGGPRRAEAFFIIDGGSMSMVGGVGSTLTLILNILFTIEDPIAPSRKILFSPALTLEGTSSGRATFTTSGPDIGATFGREVIIPLSFHNIDLGLVRPGGHIDILYGLGVVGHAGADFEGLGWRWSDPLDVSGSGAFPTIHFASAAAVPEPSSLLLAALGLFGLLGYRWRRPHRDCTNAKAA